MTNGKGKVYTAIVTPFKNDFSVDLEGLKENVQFQIENGIDGIVALGTTGEAPTLDLEEKEVVVRTVWEALRGTGVRLIVGTGSYSTAQTIKNTKLAEEWGADEVLIVTPYYNRPTQEGLYRHFKAVAEETNLGIMLYNIQGRTGQNMTTETIVRLAQLENITGVKECSGSFSQMSDIIENLGVGSKKMEGREFEVFCGDDPFILPSMSLGAVGIVSVASNLIPKEIKRLVEHFSSGEMEKARELHYELMPLLRGLFIETNPIPVKEAMNIWDMTAGGCRMPLCELTEVSREKLENLLNQYEYLRACIGSV